jgi:MoaA/NifB/PqqE/SkfB family radical SAM enzyme
VLHKLPTVDKTFYNIDDSFLPKHLLLSIDRNCNLACESCRSANFFSNQTNKDADIILKKISRS